MRNLILTVVIVLAVFTGLGVAFSHSAHGEIPAQFRESIPDEVRAWKVTCADPVTGHAIVGPIRLYDVVDRGDLPFELLGTGVSTIATNAFDAKRIADGLPAINRNHVGMSPADIIANYNKKYMPPADNLTRSYYVIGTSIRAESLPGAKVSVHEITLGNPYANSANDPIVKACPFEFTEGIRFGMPRFEVLHRLEVAWASSPVNTPDNTGRPTIAEFSTYWARLASRPGSETLFYMHLTLYFVNGELVALTFR